MISKLFSWLGPRSQEKTYDHKVNADISVVPLGTKEGASISKYTKKAGRILASSGLNEVKPHGFGTNVSGDWSKLKTAVDKIAESLLEDMEVPRLSVNLQLSFRKDKDQTIGTRLANTG